MTSRLEVFTGWQVKILFVFLFDVHLVLSQDIPRVHIVTLSINTYMQPTFQCYKSYPEDATLEFGRSTEFPSSTDQSTFTLAQQSRYTNAKVARFPETNYWNPWYGVFYCLGKKEGFSNTSVTSFFTRRYANFRPVNGNFTRTVNVGDYNIVIDMEYYGRYLEHNVSVMQRKDGGEELNMGLLQPSKVRLVLQEPVTLADEGIYEVYLDGDRNEGRGGIYRLIVRDCPAGKWNPPDCYGVCDKCYNGGVCDDKTGECICPNNFKGPNCLEICRREGGNRFGLDCEFMCRRSDRIDACSGILFCLPDPFGCSCDVGFKGLACRSYCDYGEFGPGCSQSCHCIQNYKCDRYTGICPFGCEQGWAGDNCQIPEICDKGYYGSHCINKCHCVNDSACHRDTGSCQNSICASGFRVYDGDENCSACRGAFYGRNCTNPCQCEESVCNKVTGMCEGNCLAWFLPPDCQIGLIGASNVRVNPNQPSNFTCHVHSVGPIDHLDIKLYRYEEDDMEPSGIQIVSVYKSQSNYTVLFMVQNTFPGRYMCVVSADGMNATLILNASTYELPTISGTPAASNVTATSLILRWNRWVKNDNKGDSPLTFYKIYYGDGIPEHEHRIVTVNPNVTSMTVTGLTPDTEYGFQVAAVRDGPGGTGPKSMAESVTTLCGKPLSPSGLAAETTGTPRKLVLTWKSPAREAILCREGFTHYTITYGIALSTTTKSVQISPDITHTLAGLDTYTKYTIYMTASNKDAESKNSDVVIARTMEELAPPPVNVTVLSTTSSSVTLTWTLASLANLNGNVMGYRVQYSLLGNETTNRSFIEANLDSSQLQYTIVGNLSPGNNFTIKIQLVNGAGDGHWSAPVIALTLNHPSDELPSSSPTEAVVSAIFAVIFFGILTGVVILVSVRRKRQIHRESVTSMVSCNLLQTVNVSQDEHDFVEVKPKVPRVIQSKTRNIAAASANATPQEYELEELNDSIPLADFVAFMQKNRSTGFFSDEFQNLLPADIFPQIAARRDVNLPKNRYKNISPYDSSRVKLSVINNDPDSDYINASYIASYERNHAYIASQGPNRTCVNDFWRMIWENDIRTVSMLTNLQEGAKLKCTKYWPEERGEKKMYGHISVELHRKQEKKDFIQRTMIIRKESSSWIVRHFQYTAWPDKDIPKHTSSLLQFISTVRADHKGSTSPLLVHCSAGVGRTGVVIGIDNIVSRAKRTGLVDVFNSVCSMRRSRPYMVQTERQYEFLYNAVLESILWENTHIPVSQFASRLSQLKSRHRRDGSASNFTDQFENLRILCPDPPTNAVRAGKMTANRPKNRYGRIIPMQRNRVLLRPMDMEDNDYINASFVKGSRCTFITTQMPMPNTIPDFWSMILDYKPSCIVMLNDNNLKDMSCGQYWPEKSNSTYGPFSVTKLSVIEDEDTIIRSLEVRDYSEAHHAIQQYQFIRWPRHVVEDDNGARSLLRLIETLRVSFLLEREFSIVVHCLSGVGRTGVFCAVMECIAQIIEEKAVDVFQNVKTLRADRPHLVQTEDEYAFVHSVIEQYLSSDQEQTTYANVDQPVYGNTYQDDVGEPSYENCDRQPESMDPSYENLAHHDETSAGLTSTDSVYQNVKNSE